MIKLTQLLTESIIRENLDQMIIIRLRFNTMDGHKRAKLVSILKNKYNVPDDFQLVLLNFSGSFLNINFINQPIIKNVLGFLKNIDLEKDYDVSDIFLMNDLAKNNPDCISFVNNFNNKKSV